MKTAQDILKESVDIIHHTTDVMDAMEEYAEQFKPKWISVTTPPTVDTEYNVCHKMPNGKWHVFTTGYSTEFKRFDIGSANITHWQPLPTPPEV